MATVYVVEMQRWGDPENHHYITGIHTSLRGALESAVQASELRGGKYEPKITAMEIDGGASDTRYLCYNLKHVLQLLESMNDGRQPSESKETVGTVCTTDSSGFQST